MNDDDNRKNKDLDRPVDLIKTRNIIFDKKQCSVRIPQELVEHFKIVKGDKFRFMIEFPDDKDVEPSLRFEVIKQ